MMASVQPDNDWKFRYTVLAFLVLLPYILWALIKDSCTKLPHPPR